MDSLHLGSRIQCRMHRTNPFDCFSSQKMLPCLLQLGSRAFLWQVLHISLPSDVQVVSHVNANHSRKDRSSGNENERKHEIRLHSACAVLHTKTTDRIKRGSKMSWISGNVLNVTETTKRQTRLGNFQLPFQRIIDKKSFKKIQRKRKNEQKKKGTR